MSTPRHGYRCYYARQARLYQYDTRLMWDLTAGWSALSDAARMLYRDEEEGQIHIDIDNKPRGALNLYYHHYRMKAGMESSPALRAAIRMNWETEPQDVKVYWEGLFFCRSPDAASIRGPVAATPVLHAGTSIEPYYSKSAPEVTPAPAPKITVVHAQKVTAVPAAPIQAPPVPQELASRAELQALLALFDAHGEEVREMVTGSKAKPCTPAEIEAIVAFFSVHGDEFKNIVMKS